MKRPDRRRRCQRMAESTKRAKPTFDPNRVDPRSPACRMRTAAVAKLCLTFASVGRLRLKRTSGWLRHAVEDGQTDAFSIRPVWLAPAKPGGGESVCLLLLLGAQDRIQRHERCLGGLHRLRHPRRHLFHAVEAF